MGKEQRASSVAPQRASRPAAVFAALLVAACGGNSGSPPSATTPVVVERETLAVPAGAEERIGADRLVLRNGGRIDGTLRVVPGPIAPGEAFELRVERGDLIVTGSVIVGSPGDETTAAKTMATVLTQATANGEALGARSAARARPSASAASRCTNAPAVADPASPQKDLLITVTNGDLYMHSTSCFQAGAGAPTATLVATEPVNASALDGERGGDVVVQARVIHVLREDTVDEDGNPQLHGPRFFLGRGGKGGSIEVDDARFPDALPGSLEFRAGAGGRSGHLRLIGTIDLPAVNGKVDALGWRIHTILLGIGGWGGDVTWRVGDGHRFDGLRNVTLRAGGGGAGAKTGGRGGLVRYLSAKVINGDAMPRATDVSAISGDGGDVDAAALNGGERSPVRIYVPSFAGLSTRAGSGGPVQVWGNTGHAAGGPRGALDGQTGGSVTVAYGAGGRIVSPVVHPNGIGGGGGGLWDPLGLDQIVDPNDFVHPLRAGDGGDGASFCSAGNDRAGGRGGAAGDLVVTFGRGGDGPQPGEGGTLNYDWIRFPAVGRGGSGTPPGANGDNGRVLLEVAAGGRHPTDPSIVGANSAVVGARVDTLVPDPDACGVPPDTAALGPWSERRQRVETALSGGLTTTLRSTQRTDCGATQLLPVDDPDNPGRTFATSRCIVTTDSSDPAGSTFFGETTSECVSADLGGGRGRVTSTSRRFDALTGQTTESTTVNDDVPCPSAAAYGGRGFYGGSGTCIADPFTAERYLVNSDGPTYRWGWIYGGGLNRVEHEYACLNCAPQRACSCAQDGLLTMAFRCEG